METTCKKAGCGARIRLLKTENDKTMPVDLEPNSAGNVVLIDGLAHVLKKDEAPPVDAARMMVHFATCKGRKR